MSTADSVESNRALVTAFYAAAVRGDLAAITGMLHRDFLCSAPSYLPWGGNALGRDMYIGTVLPQVARVLDFGKFSFDSLTAEGDHVVALINVGIKGSDQNIKISEHFDLAGGVATRIWVAYFEPKAVMDALRLAS